ncbi:MAG: glycosyltransferase family 4 protein [Pyrinomonadaceae bacterium]|nr:glycosyltransferase family 4 protein [Pyrinomonadaceae bacterium]
MLNIGIYVEPVGSGIGGSETVVAVLAEALAKNHRVDLWHHIPSLSAEHLAESSGTDLNNVTLRYVERNRNPPQLSRRNPWRHYKASRGLQAALSETYDVFVAVVHDIPPFCHAARGALIVLFPAPTAPYVKLGGGFLIKSAVRHPARYLYQSWEWKKRMDSYQVKTAISDFSRVWARRHWRIECEVVYPPVDTRFRRAEKESILLSVGRFTMEGEGHGKKQPEMLATFRQMEVEGLRGWEYFCVGGIRDSPEHHLYFTELQDLGAGSRVQIIANVERDRLKSLYERASIFWHAAGYGDDDDAQPVYAEHFGISTVEAMAAGCVPVVINKGGQREIVLHGVNGFLWDTLKELKEYSGALINDAQLRVRMSAAARESASRFSRKAFVENFLKRLIGSH